MFKKSSLEKQVDKVPKEVIWCKKCTISNQRPRIIFNAVGICSGCTNTENKKKSIGKKEKKN